MPVFGPESAEVLVFTFKEGVLSAVAHDLKIRASRFEIDIDEERRTVRARFDPTALRVVCAMKDGRDAPGALDDGARREIEQNIRLKVLETSRHGDIRFESTRVDDDIVAGRLELHGTTRELSLPYREQGALRVLEVRFDQREFGITPFRALMGALKIKPEITIRVSVPAADGGAGTRG